MGNKKNKHRHSKQKTKNRLRNVALRLRETIAKKRQDKEVMESLVTVPPIYFEDKTKGVEDREPMESMGLVNLENSDPILESLVHVPPIYFEDNSARTKGIEDGEPMESMGLVNLENSEPILESLVNVPPIYLEDNSARTKGIEDGEPMESMGLVNLENSEPILESLVNVPPIYFEDNSARTKGIEDGEPMESMGLVNLENSEPILESLVNVPPIYFEDNSARTKGIEDGEPMESMGLVNLENSEPILESLVNVPPIYFQEKTKSSKAQSDYPEDREPIEFMGSVNLENSEPNKELPSRKLIRAPIYRVPVSDEILSSVNLGIKKRKKRKKKNVKVPIQINLNTAQPHFDKENIPPEIPRNENKGTESGKTGEETCPEVHFEENINLNTAQPPFDKENIPPEIPTNENKETESGETEEETCPYEVQHFEENECKPLDGRRIIEVQDFFEKLKVIGNHKSLFDCGFSSIVIVSEIVRGLYSTLNLECSMCKKKFRIDTNDKEINKEAVRGIMASGGGYAQLQQFTAAIDLPEIQQVRYLQLQDQVADEWESTAWAEMKKAGEIERELAIKEGRVNKDGIPLIDVIVDGCWCKRSYQTNYAANSGCATIIGRRTGKVLFMAVKNKYCCICQKNGDNAKEHKCYKNYEGPSTGMEATIIAEGFQKSLEMHNLIYSRFIADGDSSTYAKIIETRPYPNLTVEKINCRNHILRRFCTNMQKLQTDTKYPIKDRKLITKWKLLSCRKYICDAIKHNKPDKNIGKLHNDINNSIYHAFGKHANCNKAICSQTDDTPIEFQSSSLWQRITTLTANVASHSRSLIEDVDSNVVEQFNGVIAKFVGGKRINYSKRRGYQTRCAGAVISFNSHRLLSTIYRNIYKKSPRKGIKSHENKKIRVRERHRLRSQKNKKRHFSSTKTSTADIHYGENAEQPDMDHETFKMAKDTFLKNLHKSEDERRRIESATVLQSQCGEWLELRRNLLTASNFGKVVKRRKTNSCKNIVKNMLYSTPIDHVSSIQHGRQNEAVALEQLSKATNLKIKKCGLYIDETHPFLGATPDGITDDMVVEVKCPIAPFKMGCIDAAIAEKKVHFWKKDKNGEVSINKKSDWFMQAQGQMHITKKNKCLFGVWYGENKIKYEIIHKDDDFWRKEMEPKLVSFYMDCLLPELVDPRYPKKKDIRDPEYVIVKVPKDNKPKSTPSAVSKRKLETCSPVAHRSNLRRKIDFNQF